jgi:hypothetical protein
VTVTVGVTVTHVVVGVVLAGFGVVLAGFGFGVSAGTATPDGPNTSGATVKPGGSGASGRASALILAARTMTHSAMTASAARVTRRPLMSAGPSASGRA